MSFKVSRGCVQKAAVVLAAAIQVVAASRSESHAEQTNAPSAGVSESESFGDFWCPMHPAVRSPVATTCRICRMQLIAAADQHSGSYRVEVRTALNKFRAGRRTSLRFFVHTPHTNEVVREFEYVHERAFHLFVVSRELDYFSHLHPKLERDGSLTIDLQPPRPGIYQLYTDFVPKGGAPQLVQRTLVTAGYERSLNGERPHFAPDLAAKVVDEVRVGLDLSPPVEGREQIIRIRLDHAATGAPITDLQPYLGAPGHMMIVSEDLADAVHSHPVELLSARTGPEIAFQTTFPRSVHYRIWAQFQRANQVLTAAFTVAVAPDATRRRE
jgi:hypothetical protein